MNPPPLDPNDQRHLDAAHGWLDLGDCASANAELDEIAPAFRARPDVLALRVQILVKAGRLDDAAIVAKGLTKLTPTDSSAWVTLLEIQAKLGASECNATAKEAVLRCPESPLVRYAFAVALMKEGNAEGAELAFRQSLELEKSEVGLQELRERVLDEPAFKKWWDA